MGSSSTSSSDAGDEEAERLRSVAVDSAAVAGVAASFSCTTKKKKDNAAFTEDKPAATSLKFYQARARDFLYEYLDNNIKHIKHEETQLPNSQSVEDAEDTGFHLFKRAPSGLSDKRQWQEAPKRKLQDCNPDESSEMYLANILAAAIEGTSVTLHAERAKEKALALWVLHQAKEKEEKQKEEERIALLKAQRGEQWLPSVAKDTQVDSVWGSNSPMKVSNLCSAGGSPKDLQRKSAKQKFKKKTLKAEARVVK